MRYCGQCGAELEQDALAKGACPVCQTLISREGDVIVPLAVPELPLARDTSMTVSDDAGEVAATPPPVAPGTPRWPKHDDAPAASERRVGGLRWPGVLALVIVVALGASSAGFLLKGHLHLYQKLHNWLNGTPTPKPTAPTSLRHLPEPEHVVVTLPTVAGEYICPR